MSKRTRISVRSDCILGIVFWIVCHATEGILDERPLKRFFRSRNSFQGIEFNSLRIGARTLLADSLKDCRRTMQSFTVSGLDRKSWEEEIFL